MKLTRTLVIMMLFICTRFLLFTYADDYKRWELPEGAELRRGKGKIDNSVGRRPFKFSPDSKKLFVFTSIGIWIYDVQTGNELGLVTKHTEKGNHYVVLSPDCQTFADIHNSVDENEIELWDLQTGEIDTTFDNRSVKVNSVAYQHDGKRLVSGDSDGVIRLWNIDTGKNRVIQSLNKPVRSVVFSPEGTTIISVCKDDARSWDAADGKIKAELENTHGIYRINFSPDSKLIIGETQKEIRIWDAESGNIKIELKFPRLVKLFALSPDRKTIASAEKNDTSVRLLDVHTGELKKTFTSADVTKRVESIAFSPDGKTIAVASYNEIKLWDVASGIHKTSLRGLGFIYHIEFSPDGNTLATYKYQSRNEAGIHLWNINETDLQNSAVRCIIKGHKLDVNSIAYSPDGQSIASGHKHKNIRLWDTSTGKIKTVFKGHPIPLWLQSIAFSPDGKTLASLSTMHLDRPTIYLWDVGTGQYMTTLGTHGKSLGKSNAYHPSGIAFSPNGKTLVSGSLDGMIRFWNVHAASSHSLFDRFWSRLFGYGRGAIKKHQDYVLSVSFSPDGETLATGSSDKTVRLWNAHSRKQIAILTKEGSGRINCVAFSPDGHILASIDSRGKTYIWDSITKKHIATLVKDPPVISEIYSIAFSPDGQTLICGGTARIDERYKAVVFLWDMKSQQLITTLIGHTEPIISVKYNPDGRSLASGSRDGTVLIWEIPE